MFWPVWHSAVAALEQIPATGWVSLSGNILTLAGVFFTLRHSRKLQKNQLAHDAHQRTTERQMAWRREVYLEAVQSMARLHQLIGRMADLETPDQELSRSFMDDIAKISRVELIANATTLSSLTSFTTEFTAVYTQLFTERSFLAAKRNEIKSLAEIAETCRREIARYESMLFELGRTKTDEQTFAPKFLTEIAVQRAKIDHCVKRKLQLGEELPVGQMNLLRNTLKQSQLLQPLFSPVLVAVRRELDLPLEETILLRQAQTASQRVRTSVEESLRQIDETYGVGVSTSESRSEGGSGANV